MTKNICSIIIPYYNVSPKLVNKCLNSILNQNWGNFCYEVIFINDGSTFPLENSTKRIFSKFQQFTLIKQANKGLSSARNAGINIANSDYIFFVDSDDYWFPNKIGDIIPFLKKKEYDIIKFQSVHIFDNKDIDTPQSRTATTEFISGCEYMTSSNIIMGACTYCYRTEFLKSNHLMMPEGIIHEDELFLTLAFLKAQKCLLTQIPLYAYIRRDGSIMSINTPEQWAQHLNNFYSIIKNILSLRTNTYSIHNKAIDNRLSFLLYVYNYYILISTLGESQKQHYLSLLQSINLYPLPKIGNSRMYKLLRLCSKNKTVLKFFVKAVQAINSKRVKGKIY